jgi:adenylosuccinate lyase
VDSTTLIDYMFNRYLPIVKNLIVYPENMIKNIYLTRGIIFSQRVLTELINKGVSREEAYDKVQLLANEAFSNNKNFIDLIKTNNFVKSKFNDDELEELFDLNFYKKNVNKIYEKVFVKQT